LAHHFVRKLAKPIRRDIGITAEAIAALVSRPWRGNVRELRNAIDHALIVARGAAIVPADLPDSAVPIGTADSDHADAELASAVRRWAEQNVDSTERTGVIYDRLFDVVEPPLIAEALKRNKGQCATAARALGIHRTTLRKKLIDHGLESQLAAEGNQAVERENA
jgi:two-component system nitrogen regulation response regulator GlnG